LSRRQLGKKYSIIANYSIHGKTLRFNTNNISIYSSIKASLEYFLTDEQSDHSDVMISLFDNRDEVNTHRSDLLDSHLLYSPSENDRFDLRRSGMEKFNLYADNTDSNYYLDFGDLGFLSYNLEELSACGYIQNPESISPNVISDYIFKFVLHELLKSIGYFPVHCAVVEKDDKGIMIPGFSGAGKTTSCIALIRGGFGFLGDDRPILRYGRNRDLELLSFPEHVNVTNKTINLFSELTISKRIKHNASLVKKSFFVEDIYPGSTKDLCIPRVILYPEISTVRSSYLENLSKSNALSLFLPHSMLVFDKATAKKHFDTIFDLIKSVDTYKLKLGHDIRNLPELVGSIL
jgi:hypothetical protein